MADIVVTDTSGRDLAILHGCTLDVEFGDSGENNMELTVPISTGQRVADGARIYVDGTEYGGVVDASESDSVDEVVRYTGRSWHGVLAKKVIEPPSGQSHRTVSGDANAVLLELISLLGLSGVMSAPTDESGIAVSYQFDRYTDAYTGIRKMLAAAGGRLAVEYRSTMGRVFLSAVPAVDYTSGPDSDVAGISVRRVHRTVNHLISLGEGEGTARAVRHDYIDADGKVSQTRTFTGIDEITEIYENTNADAEELAERGPERLLELQDADSLEASLDGAAWDYAVGDIVPGTDVDTGESVRVTVGTKIAVVTDDGIEVEYQAGGAKVSASPVA